MLSVVSRHSRGHGALLICTFPRTVERPRAAPKGESAVAGVAGARAANLRAIPRDEEVSTCSPIAEPYWEDTLFKASPS